MRTQTKDSELQYNFEYTIIIPVFNEEESVSELVTNVIQSIGILSESYEILFINDGSNDNTLKVLNSLASSNNKIKIVDLQANFGKAVALDTGFKLAQGKIVITMDGDLQDDPQEIPSMKKKIDQGFDLVSGWKKKRYDPWHKTIPSKLFNSVVSLVSGVKIHDFNCGFKMYRNKVIKSITVYGEMHRYIPALANWHGFKVAEIPVKHHARKFGKSKYGIERLLRGLFDFLTIAFLTKYCVRPMHFFGKIGLLTTTIGVCIGVYLSTLWFLREFFNQPYPAIGDRPLLLLSVLSIIVGVLLFSTGLIGEMIVFFSQQNNKDKIENYIIKTIINK